MSSRPLSQWDFTVQAGCVGGGEGLTLSLTDGPDHAFYCYVGFLYRSGERLQKRWYGYAGNVPRIGDADLESEFRERYKRYRADRKERSLDGTVQAGG